MLLATPTLLIGFMPTYAQIGLAAPLILLLLRIVMSVALDGEFAGEYVFVTERRAETIAADHPFSWQGEWLGADHLGRERTQLGAVRAWGSPFP